MTCIVGLKDPVAVSVWIASDSLSVSGSLAIPRSDPKVFQRGEFLIGFTTSYRMGQLLRYQWKVDPQPQGMTDYEYMVTKVVESMRECFKAGGFTTVNNNNESAGQFLIGYRAELYEIDSDFQVAVHKHPFAAVGSGAKIALGSMFSTDNLHPQERLVMALRAAAEFNVNVRGPVVVSKLDYVSVPEPYAQTLSL